MKNLYLSILLLAMTFGSVQAQNSIVLDIDHQLGGTDFALNAETDQVNYVFDITRLEYYISDIAITHDGGIVTDIEDVWILVNANGTEQFDLGNHDIDAVESISFYVGIGQDVNHDDPSAWPPSSPLAPQNPSMHWGWASGYRFVAIEGNAGIASASNLFEIHALGDENYFQSTVEVTANAEGGALTIPLTAEYLSSLNGINLSEGVINHATTGVSIPLLQNFSTEVFTAATASNLEENDFEGSLRISPNPSEGQAVLQVSLPAGDSYAINIIDISGRAVQSLPVNTTEGSIELPNLPQGVYIIELQQAEVALIAKRWVVK